MAKKNNTELIRVNINIPSNVVSRVKEYAENLGINTTSAYIVLLNQALDQKDIMNNLPLMFTMMNDLKSIDSKLDKIDISTNDSEK